MYALSFFSPATTPTIPKPPCFTPITAKPFSPATATPFSPRFSALHPLKCINNPTDVIPDKIKGDILEEIVNQLLEKPGNSFLLLSLEQVQRAYREFSDVDRKFVNFGLRWDFYGQLIYGDYEKEEEYLEEYYKLEQLRDKLKEGKLKQAKENFIYDLKTAISSEGEQR